MKHGRFDENNQLVDVEGVCTDCGKDYELFRPCDCDLKTLDETRAASDASKIVIAVVTTHEGNQEVIKTASLAEVERASYYLRGFLEKHADVRPIRGYQRPEPDFMFGQEEGIGVNFFEVEL